jgi:hypothetical protein
MSRWCLAEGYGRRGPAVDRAGYSDFGVWVACWDATCRSMGDGLDEVRTELSGNRIARVFFYVDAIQRMILLHGITKKTRATPQAELSLAKQNKRKHERA